VGYTVGDCNVKCTCYTEHGRYGLSCLYAVTVESMSSAGSVWYVWVCMVYGLYDMLEFKLCCESSVCTARVVLNASVTHLAATQYLE